MTKRTYKGFEIVKQVVGNGGWNVVKGSKIIGTGYRSVTSAKEAINWEIDSEAALSAN